MSQVTVSTELIRWAVDRAGLQPESLSKKFPKLKEWETGEAFPTFRQLENLARATMTPFGYFFFERPPDERLSVPDFRTVSDREPARRPSPNLIETLQTMQQRQDWMHEYLIDLGATPLTFLGRFTMDAGPQTVAADMRRTLRLNNHWAAGHRTWTDALRTLRESAEDAGILLMVNGVVGNNTHRVLEVDEFRGFALCDEYAPLIFVNGADAKAAQMFTVVHELAHLWIGREGISNLEAMLPADNEVEKFCNRVAADFLIPEEDLRDCWGDVKDEEDTFNILARRFKVSPLVAARRALDLGFISRGEFFEFYDAYREDDRRVRAKAKGGEFYATQGSRLGRRFPEAVIFAARQGRLLYRDAYHLTGLYGGTFDKYARNLGFDI